MLQDFIQVVDESLVGHDLCLLTWIETTGVSYQARRPLHFPLRWANIAGMVTR